MAAMFADRSPLLLDPNRSGLLVVDLQEKLVPLIHGGRTLTENAALIMDAANLLGVPIAVTEQYPKGLGPTLGQILGRATGPTLEKTLFSCRERRELWEQWHQEGRQQVVIVGIESHVCVLQTVLDLLAMGFECFVVKDATGSRSLHDKRTALSRMEIGGALITTTETTLFEWCADSRHPHFKQLSQWIKNRPLLDPDSVAD